MFTSYLTVAIRNLLKRKAYSFVNIAGLAIGLAACLLILLFIADEWSYDRQWPNSDRIYRMALIRKYPDRQTGYAIIPQSYADVVKKDFPEVEESVRILEFGNENTQLVKRGNETFEVKGAYAADSTFFKVFSVPLLQGDALTCLSKPNSIVLNEQTARQCFGSAAQAIGQTLLFLGGNEPVAKTVTGVCENLSGNTHFSFNMLESTTGFQFLQQPNFIGFSSYTYLLLRPQADARQLEAKFPQLIERYAAGQVQRNFGVDYPQYVAAGNGWHYFLQPLSGIHLDSSLEREFKPNGNRSTVTIFGIVALFILLLAAINFINLTTARSSERAREVGVRKALGGMRQQLTGQFLAEAIVVSMAAALPALGMVWLALPYFNDISDKQITFGQYVGAPQLALFMGCALMIGLLAGAYPASVLSGFKPVEVLKGKFMLQGKGRLLRNSLVVIQFAVSSMLIISTMVVLNQLNFIFEKKLGFDQDYILSIQNAFVLLDKTEAFKNELSRIPGVESVGGTNENPGGSDFFGSTLTISGNPETVTGRGMCVDDQFVQTLNMEILTGRSFSKDYNDSLSIVLNEKAVRDLGFTDNNSIIGRQVVMPNALFPGIDGNLTFTVIGVLSNFHFQSLHEPVAPLFMMHDRLLQRNNGFINLRVQPARVKEVAEQAGLIWKSFQPDQPFRYTFLDEDIAAQYRKEQQARSLFTLFAILAILIACIGLTGLAAYIAQQRTKEIGVRKVLGASVSSVLVLLARDFMKLVLIAFVLAAPVAWYFMDSWLSNFAYRIEIQWWIFVLAAAIALSLAFFTVSFQSLKAALANPIKSLRNE